jgi:DNA polymerase-1
MAHFSQDATMIAAFKAGKDIHLATATKIFQVAEKNVTTTMRRKAKMVNFGIIYGISAFGLSQRLEIGKKEASEIINAYFNEFPDIKIYMEKTIEKARTEGFVSTLLGRKRTYRDINSKNATVRGMAERAAINMPIQGTAAELIKRAMIDIYAWQQKEKIKAKMIMQVHDELVFEVHTSALDLLKKHIPLLMQKALPLSVPIVVEVGVGKNWLVAH